MTQTMQKPENSLSVSIDIITLSPLWGKARLSLSKKVPHILSMAWKTIPKKPKSVIPEITLSLIDDLSIQAYNKQYRGKNKPTNVLSFPTFETMAEIPPNAGQVPIGDILIAFETIKHEAEEQDKTLSDHFAHMLVHGFLHLLGYDHMTGAEAKNMESLEIKILKTLSIENPYR
jgi:rRNA maturation RNase YbeY